MENDPSPMTLPKMKSEGFFLTCEADPCRLSLLSDMSPLLGGVATDGLVGGVTSALSTGLATD